MSNIFVILFIDDWLNILISAFSLLFIFFINVSKICSLYVIWLSDNIIKQLSLMASWIVYSLGIDFISLYVVMKFTSFIVWYISVFSLKSELSILMDIPLWGVSRFLFKPI